MEHRDFSKIAFFAIVLIAAIGIISMYYMTETGAYSWGFGTPRDGYCRCITGPYTVGVTDNPYGGQGMEFKGFMSMQSCINTCGPTKYSWRSR